jgi:hypothetical protein
MTTRQSKISELFEVPEEPELEKPKSPKLNRKDLEGMVFDLELALVVRDRYADQQQSKINDLMGKIEHYENFFHSIELNYVHLKDHRAVQGLIDRACQWSQADRVRKGNYASIDRSAALEIATRRLGEHT